MSLAQYEALLTTPVTLTQRTRDPQTGDPGAGSSYADQPAHIEYAPRVVLNRDGVQIQGDATVFLSKDAPITDVDGWEVAPPNGDTLFVVVLDSVLDPRDGSLHHYEAVCGSRLTGQQRTLIR